MAEIEYFYAAHSAYAWIGSRLLGRIAREGGRTIAHRPYDLRKALLALGGSTGSLTPARRAYFFGRDMGRWAQARGVAMLERMPTHHANDIGLPNRLLIAGLATGRPIDDLAHALLEAHWVGDADLADAATLHALADFAGFDGAALLAAAATPAIRAIYDANTDEAIRRHVFGSPTYFVDGDMFYGQDHLELVARALVKPFSGRWPPAA